MKRWIISIPLILFLLLLTLEPVIYASTGANLLSSGSYYSFSPSSSYGGSIYSVTIGQNSYTWVTLLMMVVVFLSIAGTTVMSTFHIHRYFLRKNIRNINTNSYLRVTYIGLAIFVVTLLLAFILLFSFWYVFYVWLGTQIIGYIIYWWMNYKHGHPYTNHDIRKAYILNTASVALFLMLFLN